MNDQKATGRKTWEAIHDDVTRICHFVEHDPIRAGEAVTLAWDCFVHAENVDASPLWWSTLGLRRMRAGRDIHGSKRSKTDPWMHLTCWQSAAMQNHRQHAPGVEQVVVTQERWTEFLGSLTEGEGAALDVLVVERRTGRAAMRLKCSPGRVSQYKRQLEEKWDATA